MRQGEISSQGKWQGSPSGGVKAPEPILLPDPGRRFSTTASRLETLANGHPMEAWLRFMARIAQAQHRAATVLPASIGPDASAVAQSVEMRMPPLSADGYRRDAAWQDGLMILLDDMADGAVPPEVHAIADKLRPTDPAVIESLADTFLRGHGEPADAGPMLYVAAALQVYFTRLPATLLVTDLRLLPERGLCPCCGSTPVAGRITATGNTPGTRYLQCSLCSTEWNHVRAVCVTCGGSRAISLEGIEGDTGTVKAETCGDCRTYAKMIYQSQDTKADPVADDLASLGLDILAAEAGWSRHAPNPLLLIG